jgi:hypothetical protein
MPGQSNIRNTISTFGVAAALVASFARAGAAMDPCTLVAASEVQKYVGVLSTLPFRANTDGAANPKGSECVYRGSGGRQIAVVWNPAGAAQSGDIIDSVPNTVGGAFDKVGQPGLSANAHRVIAQGPAGPWDKANWIPGGTLFITKGDQGVNIDMSGASGSEDEAVAIARLAVPRFNDPLIYDGAHAALNVPKAKAYGAACTVVAKAAVETAIGPLSGVPVASSDGTRCD